MQADIFILGHDTAGFKHTRNIQILAEVEGRGSQTRPQFGLFTIGCKCDAVHGANIDARVAFDALRRIEDRLHIAIQAALRFLVAELCVKAKLNFDTDIF